MKNLLHTLCLIAGLVMSANITGEVYADVKIKTKADSGTESTVYIKGKRQRLEVGGVVAILTQCDMKRTVQLNGQTKTYTVSTFDQSTLTADGANTERGQATSQATSMQSAATKRGGIVTSVVTVKDTGERQQMFGYTARRIKSSTITESSPDACTQDKSRIDSDGWYIDLALEFNCENQSSASFAASNNDGGCRDQYRTKQIGTAKLGYPVKVTTTFYDKNNQPTGNYNHEVVELSKATLDAALFDVPADYREAKNAQELYAAQAKEQNESAMDNESGGVAANARTLANKATNSTQTNSTMPGAKKEGVIRIGIAPTKTTSVGEGLDAGALSAAVRNTMVNFLAGPAVEIVQLDARLPVQIEAEAKQKECDFVLYTTAAHKKGKSGGFGGFLKAATPIADVASLGGYGSTTGAVAASVTTTAIYTAANVSSSVKAKDELTLDYKLNNASGSPVIANTLKAKAKSDGDDLISNLVEQAAGAVLTQATKKQ
ncbi:MAG: DUF4412 domain-containing protein [Pyrinomonadaceae bacterium MAG19_C2-C3]|nr:DUF4412 domain-containing protein [Pyrinomonadaceae bacterium MAG19_C2-C3]